MRFKLRGLLVLIGVTVFSLHDGYNASLAKDKDKARAGNKLILGANVRFRYEYQDNFNAKYYGDHPKKGESNDGFLLGRFRFGFDYYPNETIHIALWMQDSEVWDSALKESDFYNNQFDREHNPYKDSWELYNTYLEIKKLLPFSMKLGRQVIAYGNKRIFGPGQWGNTGRWIWDAAKLAYEFEGGFVDVFYGKTLIHDPDVFSLNHDHGFESVGFYGHFELPQKLLGIAFEPFCMTKDNDRDVYKGEDGELGKLDSRYMGIRVFKKNLKGFDGDFTFVQQKGDYAGDTIDAYAYHLLLAYTFKQANLKPRISIEYSYASGDSDPNDGEHETFDGAFGARDRMYGRMNLFHWKNLKDAQVNLEIKPKDWLHLKLEGHQFWLAQEKDAWYLNPREYRDDTGNSGSKLGKEFDIVGKFKLSRGNEIQCGFARFWPDEFAKKQASDKEASWFFVQWVCKFSYPFF